ncbi:MAG TPA: hypothetical protein VMV93_11720 [Chloroflexota bacterium]|nr:hypothetical protein [Chloroflexota bacterium]
MDAAPPRQDADLGATLDQRRREVLLERVRSVALRHPEVLASVIVQWIDQDSARHALTRLEHHAQRRRLLEHSEWRQEIHHPYPSTS